MDVAPCEVGPVSVEHQVRAARVTDIDRFVALSAGLAVDPVNLRAAIIDRGALSVRRPRRQMRKYVTVAGSVARRPS